MLVSLFRHALDLATTAPLPEGKDSRARDQIAAAAGMYGASIGVQPPRNEQDYLDLYGKLIAVYRCVWLRAKGVASGKLRFYREAKSGEHIYLDDSHPVVNLFRRPNPETHGRALIEQWVSYADLTGTRYTELVPLTSNAIGEMWSMDSARTKMHVTGGKLSHYTHTVDGKPERFEPEHVHHARYWSPLSDYYGMSPLVPGTRTLVSDELSERANNAVLKNAGVLSGIYSLEDGVSQEQADAVADQVRERYTGVENQGKIMFVAGGRGFEPITMTPAAMENLAQRRFTLDQIRTSFGIPLMVYTNPHGDTSMTRENAIVQRALFYRGTIAFLARDMADDITYRLIPKLAASGVPDADGIVAEFDYSDVDVYREEQYDRAASHKLWIEAGVLTPNEVRVELGHDELDGLDETRPLAQMQVQADALKATAAAVDGVAKSLADLVAKKPPAMPLLADALDLPDDHELLEELRRIFGETVTLAGKDAIVRLGLDLDFDSATDTIREYVEHHARFFFSKTSETTQGMLADALTDGIDDGETVNELADRIRDIIGDRSGSALRGARTATTASVSKGGQEAFEQAGLEESQWNTARDEHVRDSHQPLDGQVRKLGSAFSNGLEYPGDPSGGPSETANCRCFVTGVLPERRSTEAELVKAYRSIDVIHERQAKKLAAAYREILDEQQRRVLAALRRVNRAGGVQR